MTPAAGKPARVLFIVNGFAPGGGELKLLELVERLRIRFPGAYRSVVCAVGQGGVLEERFSRAADRVVVYPKRHAYDAGLVRRVAGLIREERIDLAQTTLFYADVIGAAAARLAGLTAVVSWEAVTQPDGRLHLAAYRLASKWFTVSVAVSEAIRRQVSEERRVTPSKTRTILYGVDTHRFRPLPAGAARRGRTLGLNGKGPVFGTIARLTGQKGHRYLLEAASLAIRRSPGLLFVFAGDGPLRESLEAQARSLGISSRVRFLGFRSDVAALMGAFDAFVLPSLYEGLPNVVLEAMACGKPVVATAVDGTPEVVADGETGLLVPPRDPERLAEAILKLAGNPRLRTAMGLEARRRTVAFHGVDRQVDAFHALYQELLLS
jgi:glycosyltransferase involved in cell wall biosynthesis